MLDPRAFLINSKTGRVVAATFIEFLSGNSTNPSICFTDSPDSGLQCDNAGAVNYVKNGINLGELGTASSLIGGSDTQIQFNDSGSFGGSADLTWDDTGKELNVGGDLTAGRFIPTSSTVPTNGVYLPAANSVAISSNGVGRLFIDASGNVGIDSSGPAAKLDVNGDGGASLPAISAGTAGIARRTATATSFCAFSIIAGTASSSRLNFGDTDDEDTGSIQYLHTDNSFRFLTNATEKLRITSDGKLGLGTSSPQAKMEIVENAGGLDLVTPFRLSGTALNNDDGWKLQFYNNTASQEQGSLLVQFKTAGSWKTSLTSTNNVTFDTAGNERVRIDSSGNVGIGSTSPSVLLDCEGASTTDGTALYINNTTGANTILVSTGSSYSFSGVGSSAAWLTSSGTKVAIGPYTAGEIQFINGGEKARIDSSGRLLVGTSTSVNSNALVKVQGQAGNPSGEGQVVIACGTNTPLSDSFIGALLFTDSSGGLGSYVASLRDGGTWSSGASHPSRLVFSVTADGSASPTEAMRINNAGELLVGYTSDNGAYKLQVNSQIFATSATIATSDGRYKENVAPLNGSLDLVKALRPVSFTWKQQENITRLDEEGNEVLVREGHNFPEGTQVGFIAQEVQEVLDGKPWLGSVIKENIRPAVKDNDGNELAPEEQFYGIAEGNLIAVLTNALQEAVGRIETLEAEVAALKAV